jgi:hypothetical protein
MIERMEAEKKVHLSGLVVPEMNLMLAIGRDCSSAVVRTKDDGRAMRAGYEIDMPFT